MNFWKHKFTKGERHPSIKQEPLTRTINEGKNANRRDNRDDAEDDTKCNEKCKTGE